MSPRRQLQIVVLLGLMIAQSEGVQSQRPAAYASTKATSRAPTRRRAPAKPRRAAPPPLLPSSPVGASELSRDLAALMNARSTDGAWGVSVTSLATGELLFSANADSPLMPASTQKLLTTTLAFERLGTQHQFTTEVLKEGSVTGDGTLQGALILRGGGDPSLSSRFYGNTPEGPMRALARMVAQAGIKKVSGDLIGDATAFEDKRIPDGWLARYLSDSYAARVSALSLNANLLHVAVVPGKPGTAPSITLRPALADVPISNHATTRSGGRSTRIAVSRRPDGTINVSGWIGARAGVRVYTVVVEQPAEFATQAFRRALADEGISVTGKSRIGAASPAAALVAVLPSAPLYQLASVMNGESDNHFAELIFRNASRGETKAQVGSASLGNQQIRDILSEYAGVPPNALNMADGSGLSSFDRVTARAMTQVLSFAHRAPWAKEFHLSLPIAGRTETLRHRMMGTAAQGNLHAKTGTTADVVALAGYVTSRSGELLAFSFMYNGKRRWAAREIIDAMGATLASWNRG